MATSHVAGSAPFRDAPYSNVIDVGERDSRVMIVFSDLKGDHPLSKATKASRDCSCFVLPLSTLNFEDAGTKGRLQNLCCSKSVSVWIDVCGKSSEVISNVRECVSDIVGIKVKSDSFTHANASVIHCAFASVISC